MKPFSKPISGIAARPDEAASLRRLGNLHWGVLVAAVLLAIIGLVTVHSASAELETDYLRRQALWIVLGFVALLVVFSIDYHALVDLAPLFYLGGIGLLVLVLFVGRVAGGARSWLSLGPVGIQPSELAKLATALLLTRYLARIHRSHLEPRHLLMVGLLVAVPVVLVALERDMGSAAMFLPMAGILVLVAGVRMRLLVAAFLLAVVVAAALWTFGMRDYQRQRIASFLEPGSDPLGAGYQVRQSKIAIGSGQWVGRGYGQGTQSQLRFLPARHTDFVLAALAEEWGFLGIAIVFGLYAVYIRSAARMAMRSRDRAGILLVTALLSVFTFHVLYNASMLIGLLPITGIPLPLLSYGGSFTLASFLTTGLILNVDYRRYVNR